MSENEKTDEQLNRDLWKLAAHAIGALSAIGMTPVDCAEPEAIERGLKELAKRASERDALAAKVEQLEKERQRICGLESVLFAYAERWMDRESATGDGEQVLKRVDAYIRELRTRQHQPGDIVFRKDGEPRHPKRDELYLHPTSCGVIQWNHPDNAYAGIKRTILTRIDIPEGEASTGAQQNPIVESQVCELCGEVYDLDDLVPNGDHYLCQRCHALVADYMKQFEQPTGELLASTGAQRDSGRALDFHGQTSQDSHAAAAPLTDCCPECKSDRMVLRDGIVHCGECNYKWFIGCAVAAPAVDVGTPAPESGCGPKPDPWGAGVSDGVLRRLETYERSRAVATEIRALRSQLAAAQEEIAHTDVDLDRLCREVASLRTALAAAEAQKLKSADELWERGFWLCEITRNTAGGVAGYEPLTRQRASEIASQFGIPADDRRAIALIAAERKRQVHGEGWTDAHDDHHDDGELSRAAACYAASAGKIPSIRDEHGRSVWPWSRQWDKRDKHDRQRQLVIAGALIVAEIERIQRAEIAADAQHKGEGACE